MNMQEMTAIVKDFLATPQGRELTSSQRAARHLERTRLVKQLADIQTRADRELPRLGEAVAKAEQALRDARAKMRAAEVQYGNALGESLGMSSGLSHECAVIERRLRDSAPAEINTTLDALQADLDRMRKQRPSSDVREDGYDFVAGKPRLAVRSNREAHSARMEALRQALKDVEALKLMALDGKELAAKLEAIMAGIPPFDGLTLLEVVSA